VEVVPNVGNYSRTVRNGFRIYGEWAGNPNGITERTEDCVEGVYRGSRSFIESQCNRKRGHGPDGLYCKHHAKRHEAKP
jgi:hypothetical protein